MTYPLVGHHASQSSIAAMFVCFSNISSALTFSLHQFNFIVAKFCCPIREIILFLVDQVRVARYKWCQSQQDSAVNKIWLVRMMLEAEDEGLSGKGIIRWQYK